MAQTNTEWANQILAQLKLRDPDISAAPLTIERKLADAVADVIASAQADQYTSSYQFDIDTKVGSDLDRFIALFGHARQQGRRATGSVTFSRATPALTDIQVPVGTQVLVPATSVSPVISFNTTAAGVLFANTLSVEVPVEAAEVGPQGNVPAGTITLFGSGFASSVSEVSNENATSDGDDIESDAELRLRFKNTIFRNVSGTQDQYLALAIATVFGRKANVVGSISRFIEFLQVPNSLVVNSQIPYAKFTHSFDYFLTDGGSTNEVFYNKGTDYALSANNLVPQTNPPTAVAPTLTVLNSTKLPAGSIVLLEHTYTSLSSRNDPSFNTMNKVDVYVSGDDETSSTETVIFPTTATNFSSTTSSPYYTAKWKRDGSALTPVAGNRLQLLTWQPVTSLPTVITIGSNTFYLGINYFLVRDVTNYRSSRQGRDGIEWTAAAAGMITPGTSYTLSYDWNRLPITVNAIIDSQKQMSSDVLVHAANKRYFNLNFVQMYTPGFSTTAVDTAVTTAVTAFFESQSFGAVIQFSDILDVVHNVAGVDNVRFANVSDGGSYGIQEISSDGVTTLGAPLTSDFSLLDSDLPVLNAISVSRRSQNSYGF